MVNTSTTAYIPTFPNFGLDHLKKLLNLKRQRKNYSFNVLSVMSLEETLRL